METGNATTGEKKKHEANRNSKDSVFCHLFQDPKYQCRLVRERHPELTHVTEEDIQLVTLRPVMVHALRNDFGLLVEVKDPPDPAEPPDKASGEPEPKKRRRKKKKKQKKRYKLLILVEAQSTWTKNILIRLLLYLAAEYQKYLSENKANLFGSKLVELPEPEFYVVYCGAPRKRMKSTVSLREDVFENPEAKLDLVAEVICSPDETGILNEYVGFCHVWTAQAKQYGLTLRAVEETVRICKERNLLREYLEHLGEVELMMLMEPMFDEEFWKEVEIKERREAIRNAKRKAERRGRQIGKQIGKRIGERRGERRGGIATLIEAWQEFGKSYEETAEKVAGRFRLDQEQTDAYMKTYWKL